MTGFLLRKFWSGPAPAQARPFDELQRKLVDIVHAMQQRAAPNATILLVTYPNAIPEQGTCARIELSEPEAALMRDVAKQLADVTRAAANEAGAILVDIAGLSKNHDACSAEPWVNGAAPERGAQFHPNLAGARAIAAEIARVLQR